MAKRNHHTFHLRSDAIFFYNSPYFRLFSSFDASQLPATSSATLCWCKIPSNGTNPCHFESTLCTLSFTGLFCLFLLVQSSPTKKCHFHTVTKSSVYSSIEITFQVFSGIADINYLINYRQSIKLRVSPATSPEGNLLNRHITTLSNRDLSWHNKPTDKNSYNASACINISSYS